MSTLLASIPDALKRRILAGLEQSFSFMDSPDYKEAETLFEPYAEMIALELHGYVERHTAGEFLCVSEIDMLLESQRIRQRVFEKHPGSRTIASLMENYALGHKRTVYNLKKDFFRAGGQEQQFEALLEIAENNVSFQRKLARPPQSPGAPFIG